MIDYGLAWRHETRAKAYGSMSRLACVVCGARIKSPPWGSFVERLWRSLKYEEVYPNAYATVAEAKAGIGCWLDFYNTERQHQSLGYRTPRQIYQEGLWICGRSALPTGCASPASRAANSESSKMLAVAHIPTGTATNHGFDIDEVSGRLVKPAVASTAIGADIETGRATP